MKTQFPLLLVMLLLALPLVLGTTHDSEELKLPPGLQQIESYTEQVATEYLTTATIFIAFLAGILTLLSPCILPLLPAFFSYTFGTRKRITLMTLVFFAGFALMFTAIALAVVFLGVSSTAMFQVQNLGIYVRIVGALLMLVGALGILGFTIPGMKMEKETSTSTWGVFLYGALFAIGWTACVGPILSGVILMASVFQNYATAALLVIFYSLGIFLPLFLLSVFYDKLHLERVSWIKGKMLTYNLLGKPRQVHTSGLIAGILFFLLGVLFLFTGGTAVVNSFDLFGTKSLFYSWQPILLEKASLFNGIGIAVLLFLVGIILWGLKRQSKRAKKE